MISVRRGYPGLDLLRVAAALMVAVYHFTFFDVRDDPRLVQYWADANWCGVHIFFVISGFVIAFSAQGKSAGQFVLSRVSRLYPAAWICATISLVIAGASLDAYVRSLTLFPLGPWVNGIYWTLPVEIAFYALVAVALWRGWKLHLIALLLGGVSTAYWLLRSFGIDGRVGPYLHYGCYFALGMLLYQRRSPLAAALFLLAGAIGLHWNAEQHGWGFAAPLVWLIAMLIAAAAVFWNEEVTRATARWPTRTLGLVTYPLYLVHDDIGRAVLGRGFGWPLALLLAAIVAFLVLPLEELVRRLLFVRAPKEASPTAPP